VLHYVARCHTAAVEAKPLSLPPTQVRMRRRPSTTQCLKMKQKSVLRSSEKHFITTALHCKAAAAAATLRP
jgi:hypothetical protein